MSVPKYMRRRRRIVAGFMLASVPTGLCVGWLGGAKIAREYTLIAVSFLFGSFVLGLAFGVLVDFLVEPTTSGIFPLSPTQHANWKRAMGYGLLPFILVGGTIMCVGPEPHRLTEVVLTFGATLSASLFVLFWGRSSHEAEMETIRREGRVINPTGAITVALGYCGMIAAFVLLCRGIYELVF